MHTSVFIKTKACCKPRHAIDSRQRDSRTVIPAFYTHEVWLRIISYNTGRIFYSRQTVRRKRTITPERKRDGGGEKGVKGGELRRKEQNEESSEISGRWTGVVLAAELKTSARNIAIAKALICNLLPSAPSTSRRGVFPRQDDNRCM